MQKRYFFSGLQVLSRWCGRNRIVRSQSFNDHSTGAWRRRKTYSKIPHGSRDRLAVASFEYFQVAYVSKHARKLQPLFVTRAKLWSLPFSSKERPGRDDGGLRRRCAREVCCRSGCAADCRSPRTCRSCTRLGWKISADVIKRTWDIRGCEKAHVKKRVLRSVLEAAAQVFRLSDFANHFSKTRLKQEEHY